MQCYRNIKSKNVRVPVYELGLKIRPVVRNKGESLSVGEILLCLLAEKGGWI